MNLVDPQGEDVYRFDKESGDFILYQKTEDNYDMVGKFRKESDGSFTLKYKKNGAPKEIIGHVEKGILSDGINFKNQDHVFEVSEITGLTLKGVETFLIEITGLVNKEVGGYYYSVLGNGEITHVSVGNYYNNESHKTKAHGLRALVKAIPSGFVQENVVGMYHTHPHDLNYPNRFTGSPEDIKSQNEQKAKYPWLRFFVLTQPNYGQEQYKFEY